MLTLGAAAAEWDRIAKRAIRRRKLLTALKREHWQTIVDSIQALDRGGGCFGTFESALPPYCRDYLLNKEPIC